MYIRQPKGLNSIAEIIYGQLREENLSFNNNYIKTVIRC
jgi:hypothetical protein